MSERLQRMLSQLDAVERMAGGHSPLHGIDARAKVLVTVVFLITMLSVPLERLSQISLFFIYPILLSARGGQSYARLFRRSLFVVPFVALVGVFNLFYDREPVFWISKVAVTEGCITFVSILFRGLLSVQALLILVGTTGYYALCRSLERLGLPSLFVVQLLFVYRYLEVLVAESLAMTRARDARSFGRKSYPLRIWSMMVGQLLIRTFNRAGHIHRAMLARGFSGRIPDGVVALKPWHRRDSVFVVLWSAALVLVRWVLPMEKLLDGAIKTGLL